MDISEARTELRKVFELRELVRDPASCDAYFQRFELTLTDPVASAVWRARERELQRLDDASWECLKAKAAPYLMARHERRGWHQLIHALNETRGYGYLIDSGHSGVRFIPEKASQRTPDLEGISCGVVTLCEVKTIGSSDVMLSNLATGDDGAGGSAMVLGAAFLVKLDKTLREARCQLLAYGPTGARRIVFLCVDFDDWPGEHKRRYYAEIDDHLRATPWANGIDVVFYNEPTVFHCDVVMANASVVNPPRLFGP